MAEDDLKIEFHLTSNGWIRGTSTYFGHVKGKKLKRPVGTVESCELHIYQRSPWSSEERKWSSKWKSSEVSDDELKRLYKKFPKPDENAPE